MKVLAFLFIVASVSAKGSGPYLPSGWKPDGPAFYLPTEVVKPLAPSSPITDLVLDVSEASGSDSLREYGPPAVSQNVEPKPSVASQDLAGSEASGSDSLSEYGLPIISDILKQGLPDAVTEQNFYVELNLAVPEATSVGPLDQGIVQESVEQTTAVNVEAVDGEKEINESEVYGAEKIEEKTEIESLGSAVTEGVVEATESSQVTESTEFVEPSAPTIAVIQEDSQEVSQQVSQDLSQQVTESILEAKPTVQNIPDIIDNLEKEIISQQVEVNASVSDGNSDIVLSGSLEQAPEGFLEYGPPGFSEYGPPQEQVVGNLNSLESIDSNAVRRRRFSPKFRSSKKH